MTTRPPIVEERNDGHPLCLIAAVRILAAQVRRRTRDCPMEHPIYLDDTDDRDIGRAPGGVIVFQVMPERYA